MSTQHQKTWHQKHRENLTFGQRVADGVKFLFKEEFTPSHVDKLFYFLAPLAIFTAAICVFAVIPFGSVLPIDAAVAASGPPPLPLSRDGRGEEGMVRLMVAPGLDVGVMY